jgi:hypothetical protein
VNLRSYLDCDNQMINPTLKPKTKLPAQYQNRDLLLEAQQIHPPPTTKKFEAHVTKTREKALQKKQDEEKTF